MKDFIEAVGTRRFSLVFLCLLLMVLPGTSVVYYYKQQLFLDFDVTKLVLFSLMLVAPLIFINFILVISKIIDQDNFSDEDAMTSLSVAIFMSGFITYVSLFISWILKFEIKTFFYVVLGIQTLLVIVEFNEQRKTKKNR